MARVYDLNSIIFNFPLYTNLLHTKVKVSDLSKSCEINRVRQTSRFWRIFKIRNCRNIEQKIDIFYMPFTKGMKNLDSFRSFNKIEISQNTIPYLYLQFSFKNIVKYRDTQYVKASFIFYSDVPFTQCLITVLEYLGTSFQEVIFILSLTQQRLKNIVIVSYNYIYIYIRIPMLCKTY